MRKYDQRQPGSQTKEEGSPQDLLAAREAPALLEYVHSIGLEAFSHFGAKKTLSSARARLVQIHFASRPSALFRSILRLEFQRQLQASSELMS